MNRVDFAAIVTHAYFYLIREREFAIRGEDVYKLGITKQVMGLKIPRFDGYKKGSELVMITECPMALLPGGDYRNFSQKILLRDFSPAAGGEAR